MTDREFDGVLVYDGDCPFCSAASSALRRVDGVGAVSWEDDAARSFLRAQFDDVPFALVFADGAAGEVYVGRDAAEELCERAGLPVLVSDVVGGNYESIAEAVRTVSGADRDPDSYHCTVEMSDEAAGRYPDLAATASGMPLRMEGR